MAARIAFVVAVMGMVVGMAIGGEPAAAQGGGMSKVRVAGRGFEAGGKPFVPFGVNYFRPRTGWAPKLWKMFDAEATRKDLALLKSMGGNCVRVFLSYGSFYNEVGKLDEEGLAKLDEFLKIAEEAGVYVHPTGPDHWEGTPAWANQDRYADEKMLEAQAAFWRLLAARYKGRGVIWAYDLLNEPMVRWDSPAMRARWNRWVKERYETVEKAAAAWGVAAEGLKEGQIAPPAAADKAGDAMLLDYQRCREEVADEWTRRQVEAIKGADGEALVTVGFIQWAVPVVMPRVDMYAGFRPARQAKWLDFLEYHFYPLERGAYEYEDGERELRNLAYVEAIGVEMARAGKPVVVAEFGWHGGGTFPMGSRESKVGSEEQQARWCRRLVETTAPVATGWLNWGFYDHPGARDVTARTGLLTSEGKEKAWGKAFRELAERYTQGGVDKGSVGERPALDWDECVRSAKACDAYRERYIEAFRRGEGGNQPRMNSGGGR